MDRWTANQTTREHAVKPGGSGCGCPNYALRCVLRGLSDDGTHVFQGQPPSTESRRMVTFSGVPNPLRSGAAHPRRLYCLGPQRHFIEPRGKEVRSRAPTKDPNVLEEYQAAKNERTERQKARIAPGGRVLIGDQGK